MRTGKTLTMRPVCTMVAPIRPGEVRPQTGDRCQRCHRTAPRSDGIPCGLCSPYGATTIDENGITHTWPADCETVFALIGGYPVVSGSPVDCMTCLVHAARRT